MIISAGPSPWRSWLGKGSLLINGRNRVEVAKATNLRRLSVAAVNVVLPAEEAVSIIFGVKGSVISQTCNTEAPETVNRVTRAGVTLRVSLIKSCLSVYLNCARAKKSI